MAHQLVFSSEKEKSRSYPVAGERLSIGRHPKNAIVLEDELVSIYHAEVFVENGKTLLRDLKSSNGTKVNRKRITEAALNDGDEIRFGPIVCHFHAEKISAKIPAEKPSGKSTSGEKPSGEKNSKAVAAMPALPSPAPLESLAEPGPPVPFLRKLALRVSESRYFMLSLFLHSAIVILAGSLVLYQAVQEPPDFVAEGGDGLISDANDLPPPPETPADTVPADKIVQQAPTMNAPSVATITTTATNANFKTTMPQVQVKLAPSAASLTGNLGSSRAFAANLPGTLGGRMGAGRARAMALNGMKPKSEQAVLRGLVWLAQHQNEDGSWGDQNKGAMTGFGVLCFLGHGELQDSPQFGKTVGRALTWIFENGTKNEGHLHMAQTFSSQGVYEHAICAYALGEYYTMTKDKRVVNLLKQAIAHIIEGQGPFTRSM